MYLIASTRNPEAPALMKNHVPSDETNLMRRDILKLIYNESPDIDVRVPVLERKFSKNIQNIAALKDALEKFPNVFSRDEVTQIMLEGGAEKGKVLEVLDAAYGVLDGRSDKELKIVSETAVQQSAVIEEAKEETEEAETIPMRIFKRKYEDSAFPASFKVPKNGSSDYVD